MLLWSCCWFPCLFWKMTFLFFNILPHTLFHFAFTTTLLQKAWQVLFPFDKWRDWDKGKLDNFYKIIHWITLELGIGLWLSDPFFSLPGRGKLSSYTPPLFSIHQIPQFVLISVITVCNYNYVNIVFCRAGWHIVLWLQCLPYTTFLPWS